MVTIILICIIIIKMTVSLVTTFNTAILFNTYNTNKKVCRQSSFVWDFIQSSLFCSISDSYINNILIRNKNIKKGNFVVLCVIWEYQYIFLRLLVFLFLWTIDNVCEEQVKKMHLLWFIKFNVFLVVTKVSYYIWRFFFHPINFLSIFKGEFTTKIPSGKTAVTIIS